MSSEGSRAPDLMQFLHRLAESIAGVGSVAQLFDAAFQELSKLVPVDLAVGVMLEQNLNLFLSRRPEARKLDESRLMDRIRSSLTSETMVNFESTEAMVVSDHDSLPSKPIPAAQSQHECGTVLRQDNRVAGLIAVYRSEAPFSKQEQDVLHIVSSILSLVLSNIRAQQKIQQLADQDELTGMGNKRSMRKRLAAEVERSRIYKVPLSVLMFDVDDFKYINDNYGHPLGDVLLSELCGAIKETLRPTDHLARFGGDEFTIVLPHTDLKGARATADRILERVRKLRLTTDDGRMVTTSVSIGLASFLDSDQGPADLLQRADDRLYDSKHGGKNKVSW